MSSGNKTDAPMQVGNLEVVTIADPGVGNSWAYTAPPFVAGVDGGKIQRVLSIRYTLTTGVTVATRVPGIRVRESVAAENLQLDFSDESTSQAASQTFSYLFQLGMPVRFYTVALNKMVAMSPIWLQPGQTIDPVVDGGGFQVTDAFTRIRLVLQSWNSPLV